MAEKLIQLGEKNYNSLYNILRAYRRSGGNADTMVGEFNRFDNPGTLYFRIFFDFQTGLLDCVNRYDLGKNAKLSQDEIWNDDVIIRNSALNYLTINNEWERADMLRNFINLLSNISTYSPWYFMSIDGLNEVLDRTEYTADSFMLPELKTVSIKCMPDASDQRIGTLLDLYRAICYSQQLHKEIVPANLRRFNMYIYIFPANTRGIHTLHKTINNTDIENKEPVSEAFATFDHDEINVDLFTGDVTKNTNRYLTSSKLILLKGCEIDVNANKSGYESISNEEGFNPTYTIPIKIRSAEEQRYNEFLMRRIGDLVVGDMDIPDANDDSAGTNREVIWDSNEADKRMNVVGDDTSADERLDNIKIGRIESIPTIDSVINRTNANDEIEANKNRSLESSMYRDRNKPSLLDPWLNAGEQQAERLAGYANRVLNAGKSAVSSYTDIERLNGNAAAGVNGLVNRLIFGNIFETNLQSIATGVSSGISSMASGRVIDSSLRGDGWTRSTNEPAKDIGGNIFNR